MTALARTGIHALRLPSATSPWVTASHLRRFVTRSSTTAPSSQLPSPIACNFHYSGPTSHDHSRGIVVRLLSI